MKFLCVFCVVLYLHTGVTTSDINDVQDVLYDQPANTKSVDYQKSDGSISNQHNSNESPVKLNDQSQKPADYSEEQIIQKDNNDQSPKSEGVTLEPQKLTELPTKDEFQEPQKPTETILSHTLLQDSEFNKNLRNSGSEQSFQDSGQEGKNDIESLILPNTYRKPDYLNSDKNIIDTFQQQQTNLQPPQPNIQQSQPNIQQPTLPTLKSNEPTKLELEAITLEKIKDLIRNSQGTLTNEKLASITNSNLDKDTYNYLQYIITKAKKLQNIHSSAKELKRYTIVHPDGSVEHTDQLDNVVKKNPQYVAVKSADLGKYAINWPKPNNVRKLQKATNEDPIPITSKNINVDNRKPNKVMKSTKPVLVKENLEKKEVNINKHPQNSETKQLADTANVKNIDGTLQNVSSEPLFTNKAKILPVQKSTNAKPQQSKQDHPKELLKNNKNISSYIKLLSSLPVFVQNNKTDNFDNKSSSPISPVPSLGNIDHSGLWFQDRDFWEKLKNDARNVFYFLFVPSTPQVKKETKTTIYANGTTVEEVTEIVDNEDGIPTATKTTKVTHTDAII